MYKLTRPDGYDFYSGTINYRDAIGTVIRVTDFDPPEHGVCGHGLHASRNPNNCFVGAKIPCIAFKVQGIGKIIGDSKKSRYRALKIIKEIHDLNNLFGWNYIEAANPIHPFKIKPPEITEVEFKLLKKWASVGASVEAYVGDSVGASVWNSVGAYIGSLFPAIKKWKYIDHRRGHYPFQPAVDLWKIGLVPSFDGKVWRLHGGKKGKIYGKEKYKKCSTVLESWIVTDQTN